MKTDKDTINSFLKCSLDYALSLPVLEAKDYIKGRLLLVGDQEEVAALRLAFVQFYTATTQFEVCSNSLVAVQPEDASLAFSPLGGAMPPKSRFQFGTPIIPIPSSLKKSTSQDTKGGGRE